MWQRLPITQIVQITNGMRGIEKQRYNKNPFSETQLTTDDRVEGSYRFRKADSVVQLS